MAAIRIKIPIGREPGLSSFAPFPHCPFSLTFVRRLFLGMEVLVLEPLHSPHIVKCAKRKLFSTLPGIDPRPLWADRRPLSAVLYPLHYSFFLSSIASHIAAPSIGPRYIIMYNNVLTTVTWRVGPIPFRSP